MNGSNQLSAVFDTNVWFAAKYADGLARRVVRLIASKRIQAITNQILLDELTESLSYKKQADVFGYVSFITSLCEVVFDDAFILPPTVKRKLRDLSDTPVITAALAGQASLIVTIDQDLIALKRVEGVGIVHPKTLLHILGSAE